MYSITLSKTINLGDYNSFKAEITLSKKDDEDSHTFIIRAHQELDVLVEARNLKKMTIGD